MHTEYKSFDGSVLVVPLDTFNGYKVVFQPNGRLWRIEEMSNNVCTGLQIKFWPSAKRNMVNVIKHSSGMFQWYDMCGFLTEISHFSNDLRFGECHHFSNTPTLSTTIKYYNEGVDITDEVLNGTEDVTKLNTEDKFNLFITYGSEFKLFDDYYVHIDLDKIISFCSK